MYYIHTYIHTCFILSLQLDTVGCESQDVVEGKSCCISDNELPDDTVVTCIRTTNHSVATCIASYVYMYVIHL